MAEGRVGVNSAVRWRKTVPHFGTTDREGLSSELGPSSLYSGCSSNNLIVVDCDISCSAEATCFWFI